ncbi:hypothetical protein M440DRAFT_1403255 [Trichoderma longibrachiatum ATCC 18648]|uniref:Uncharacterized protein n=1 Tax=Trichoderma longibrachiatum ATCC 18648 TaxID=983965 RepID=A0A2T4BZK7_TRILO|nr:hypothetical protein M440DRAFT_1403255 [Trichoderma longibrachiatum ATCC 18648]
MTLSKPPQDLRQPPMQQQKQVEHRETPQLAQPPPPGHRYPLGSRTSPVPTWRFPRCGTLDAPHRHKPRFSASNCRSGSYFNC